MWMYTAAAVALLLLGLPRTLSVSTEAPENEAPHCKELFTFGYVYSQFFDLPITNKMLDGNLFEIKFKVKARSDAHILLSPYPSPEESESVYEIVLGAGGNTFSEIRRLCLTDTKTSIESNYILSGTEYKGFWVKMNLEGMIEVGNDGEDLPFMTWQDSEPLEIRYFSFSTWVGVGGDWLYGCDLSDNESGSLPFQTQSAMDRLKEALLTKYDSFSRPVINSSDPTVISFQIEANHVDIDMKTAVMSVACSLTLIWKDEKMIWDPENYDSLDNLNLAHNEIWKPQLIHFNAVGKEVYPFSWTGMQVSSKGEVRWRPHSLLQSHCQLDLRSWPWDTQTCSTHLGFLNQPDTFKIFTPENGSALAMQKTTSEWEVLEMRDEFITIKMPWLLNPTGSLPIDSDDAVSSSALTFTFTLRRVNNGCSYTLVIPLLVIIVMSLTCFWMDTLGREKLVTNCLLLVLLCGFMISLDIHLPATTDYIPYMLKVYSWVLAIVGFTTVISVFISSFIKMPYLKPPPRLLINILSSQFIGTLLCLPKSQPAADCYEQVCEGQTEDSLTSWALLAVACDRVAFISAFIAYSAILIC